MDDLWSLLHILAELRGSLPWSHAPSPEEILDTKKTTPAEVLLENCPVQLIIFQKHLKFSDPYDWEFDQLLCEKLEPGPESHILPVEQPIVTQSSTNLQLPIRTHSGDMCANPNPFPAEYFASNPLGF
ncbi:unnamed protein product [Strongylus vulgaris]|uniref:Uncharacterized protein n=1 Tax=Strongylus vulgaris TaxID=40348 RepID=A0A3P7KTQ8_STRVU|nr:unnamed protein product [Strongylus vulgaris]